MKVHTTDGKAGTDQLSPPKRRSPLPMLIILLIAFTMGGCLVLLIVNRLLVDQTELYVSLDSMAAASAIIDFLDDLLPLYLIFSAALLLLLVLLATVWAWTKTQSCLLRYGTILLMIVLIVLFLGLWFTGRVTLPIPLPPA